MPDKTGLYFEGLGYVQATPNASGRLAGALNRPVLQWHDLGTRRIE